MIRGTSLRADLAGGIAGGVVTIPSSIGYGELSSRLRNDTRMISELER